MKKRYFFLLSALLCVISFWIFLNNVKSNKHNKVDFEFKAMNLYNIIDSLSYNASFLDLEKSYLGKIFQIQGNVTYLDTSKNQIVMDNHIFCSFNKDSEIKSLENNKDLIIQGRYVGYSRLFRQLQIDNCFLVK